MAFVDDEGPRGRDNLAIKLVAFLAFLGGVMGIGFLTTGSPFFAKQEWTTERIDRELQQSPLVGDLYRTVKAAYPQEYQAFLGQAAETASRSGQGAVERLAYNFSRQLMIRHFSGLARAPNPHLVDITRQYAQLLRTLQQSDPRLCAQFVTSGVGPGSRPPREAMAILSRIGVLQIRAARAGETGSRAMRPDLTPEEAQTLVGEIGRRSPEAGRLLTNETALRTAPVEQQCATGLAIYETVATLPPETAAKAMVSLLREAFGPGQTVGG